MRPLELKLRNFRSYSGEHSFDFRERRLVGIVGPLGSCNSSILDGISFALYGGTPRLGSATKALINQRAADMSVVLRFVVEDEVWKAARSIRIKGTSQHALYRYEQYTPDAEPIERLTMEGEVNKRIIGLLGLDFSAFERSVLLAQGRFAEFLQALATDRDKVLKGVFGHNRVDRMKGKAKERRDKASHALAKLLLRLEKVDAVKQLMTQSQGQLRAARGRMKRLDEAATEIADLEDVIKSAADTMRTTRDRLEAFAEHADRLPDQNATRRGRDHRGRSAACRVT